MISLIASSLPAARFRSDLRAARLPTASRPPPDRLPTASRLDGRQMRVSYLLASETIVNPSVFAFVALELGRTAEDAPDAW